MPLSKYVQNQITKINNMEADEYKDRVVLFIQWMKLVFAVHAYLNRGGNDTAHLKKAYKFLKSHEYSVLALYSLIFQGHITAVDTRFLKNEKGAFNTNKLMIYSECLISLLDKKLMSLSLDLDEVRKGDTFKVRLKAVYGCVVDSQPDLLVLAQDKKRGSSFVPNKWISVALNKLPQEISTPEEQLLVDIESAVSKAEEIKELNAHIEVGSGDVRELVREKKKVIKEVVKQAELSSDKSAVLSAVGSAIGSSRQTETAKQLGLSDDQEEAMLLRGKGIIAAGAGSGKTRVLAGKIVHLLRSGVNPENIMACSFTAKSAGELKERVINYGGEKIKLNDQGFGTTHSISKKILQRIQPKFLVGKTLVEDDTLLREAILQVQTNPSDVTGAVPPPVSFFDEVLEVPKTDDDLALQNILISMYSTAEYAKRNYGDVGRKGKWIRDDMALYESVKDKSYADLSQGEKDALNAWLKTNRGTKRLPQLKQKRLVPESFTKFASASVIEDVQNQEKVDAMEDGTKEVVPVNQWFNIGVKLTNPLNNDKPLSASDAGLFIGKMKSELISSSQAYHDNQNTAYYNHSLVYCAYEWLKNNKNMMDHEDYMVRSTVALTKSPQTLKEIQAQYQHIMVDEAQDLNTLQHTFFGLIAGSVDENTLLEKEGDEMTAKDYIFIGDDKQAIYGFRGAKPETFINKSDSNGGNFVTKYLKTNYRSGANIVRSANQLMKHNSKQIPMVCEFHPSRNEGDIGFETYNTSQDGADASIREIADEIKLEPLETWKEDYPKYGVACRTNKEIGDFVISCIVNDVPFSCKKGLNPFSGKTYKALFTLLDCLSPNGIWRSVHQIKNIFDFGLDDKFSPYLKAQAKKQKKTYVDYLLNTLGPVVYTDPKSRYMNEKNVKPYAEFINKIRDSRLDGVELFDFILDLEDINGKKVKDTIIALQKNQNSKETMDYTQNNDETLSEDEVKENARAPLDILRKLIAQRSSMEEAIEFLSDLRFKGDQLAKKKDEEDNFKAVMLDTCHGWKGLEAQHVVVPMNDGTFPPAKRESQSDEEYQQSLEDERRLAYVALTRGRDKVKIITSLINHKGKPAKPSQFIEEGCIRPNAQGVSDFSSENIRLSNLRSIADSVLAYTITDDDLPDSFFR